MVSESVFCDYGAIFQNNQVQELVPLWYPWTPMKDNNEPSLKYETKCSVLSRLPNFISYQTYRSCKHAYFLKDIVNSHLQDMHYILILNVLMYAILLRLLFIVHMII